MSAVAVGGSVSVIEPVVVGLMAFSRYRTYAASNFAYAVLINPDVLPATFKVPVLHMRIEHSCNDVHRSQITFS